MNLGKIKLETEIQSFATCRKRAWRLRAVTNRTVIDRQLQPRLMDRIARGGLEVYVFAAALRAALSDAYVGVRKCYEFQSAPWDA
jgi:hypothetical protein